MSSNMSAPLNPKSQSFYSGNKNHLIKWNSGMIWYFYPPIWLKCETISHKQVDKIKKKRWSMVFQCAEFILFILFVFWLYLETDIDISDISDKRHTAAVKSNRFKIHDTWLQENIDTSCTVCPCSNNSSCPYWLLSNPFMMHL